MLQHGRDRRRIDPARHGYCHQTGLPFQALRQRFEWRFGTHWTLYFSANRLNESSAGAIGQISSERLKRGRPALPLVSGGKLAQLRDCCGHHFESKGYIRLAGVAAEAETN